MNNDCKLRQTALKLGHKSRLVPTYGGVTGGINVYRYILLLLLASVGQSRTGFDMFPVVGNFWFFYGLWVTRYGH